MKYPSISLLLLDADKFLGAGVQHVAELPGGEVHPHPDHSAPVPPVPQPDHGAVADGVRHAAELDGVLDHNQGVLRHELLKQGLGVGAGWCWPC